MSPDQEHRLEEIFYAVRDLPPQERTAFLERACGGDAELRRQADSLLAAHEQVGQFLQPTAVLPTPNAPVEKPGDHIGRYKLQEQIGEGGFGVVWMAEQEEPVRRRVALKIIKLGMDTKEVVARFEAERQALAMMDHPHIASVFDGGATDTGRPYFVMELVKGVPITDYCDVNKLSTRERLNLFMQVCQAVQHAHQKGVIHRDLKPSNILVTVKDDRPVPKVIDFGIAKATQARLTEKTLFTRFQQWIGTPAYMSPEQAGLGSLDVDTRSDIYSLGVLLYELLTGRTPFDTQKLLAAGYDAVMRTIREEEPPKPSTRLSTLAKEELSTVAAQRGAEPAKLGRLVRGDLDWIVMKALEKDRTRRYETATGLALDLQHYLNDEPVVAGPPAARYRVKKFVRKHRRAVAVVAGFVVLLAVAAVVSTGLAVWANRERGNAWRAEAAAKKAQARTEQEAFRANQERAKAMRAEATAKAALAEMQLQRAEDFFAADDSARAVAHLASVLTSDRSNRVAAERLLSALAFRSFHVPLTEPLRHKGTVSSAQFSPDGLRVVTASYDSTARVWDAQTGKPLTEPLRHKGTVGSAHFSPDGLRVVTASSDNTARVWDAQTGKPLTEPLRHERTVNSAQFSLDGLRVVTVSSNSARVWDAQTGKPLTEPLRHKGTVNSARFSPDGLRVVTASSDNTACVWDAQTGKPFTKPLRHEGTVDSAQFSPDGLRVVTASVDLIARVWDAQTGRPITELLGHRGKVNSAQFSPDGLRVVTASYDSTARVWDAQTGKPLIEPLRHEWTVNCAQFSPDGLRVVTASHDNTARVWDAQTGKPLTEPLRHEVTVDSAQFSPDGLRVLTVSSDSTARLWHAQMGQSLTEPLKHIGGVMHAQFSPDGLRVVTASYDFAARVWDARTSRLLIKASGHKAPVMSARFSPDGRRVVTASWDETARVWDAETGKPLTEPMKHNGRMVSAQFSPDGQRVVTASSDLIARVWDAQSGGPITEMRGHRGSVNSAQFSPDGLRVVTASYDSTARVWDAQTGKPLTEPLRHEDVVACAQFSPDGLRVVTASEDCTARVWDAQTGKPLTEPLRHEAKVSSAQFSPDGRWVVTASQDRTARMWDGQSGRLVTEPLRHDHWVHYAEFSPDGLRVVTASYDKTARVWDAQTGKPLTEPLRHGQWVSFAQFSPDGRQVVTASGDNTARVWEMPVGSVPVPPWFAQMAESMVGKRLKEAAVLESVAPKEFLKLKEHLMQSVETNYYARWAKWFCSEPSTRTLSPLSSITVPECVLRRIEENTLESLREAVILSPTNGLAFSRLAKLVLAQNEKDSPRRVGEADFFSRHAVKLAPQDAEVAKIRAEIEGQIKNLSKP